MSEAQIVELFRVHERLEQLDARRRNGLFRVRTESGSCYYVQCHRGPAGGVEVISGDHVKALRKGLVGSCGCPDFHEPVIHCGQPMHLGAQSQELPHPHIVQTSAVRMIEHLEGSIRELVCGLHGKCPGYRFPGTERCVFGHPVAH